MTDKVIEAINSGTLTADNLTHETLREKYKRQPYEYGPEALSRGRGIFDDTDQLDQYLYSYGKMGNEQWEKQFEFSMIDGDTTIIDYGCGQGLSFLNLVCRWSHDDDKTWQDYLKSVILIEPSQIALNRAQAIAQLKFPDATIRTIHKKLEELDNNDLLFDTNKVMIHIFSQILDITLADEFDLLGFFETITSTIGTHYIHVVSHEVDGMNNQTNVLKLYKHIVSKHVHTELSLDDLGLKTDLKEPEKVRRTATNMALNTFNIPRNDKNYTAMFVCIKTV